jgi:SRSO17 transposase
VELLLADPATAPHDAGVLVIDDSGDRRDGTKTAHVGHQWLGRYGKTDNGVVTVTTREGEERSGVPDQAGDRRGSGGQGPSGRVRLPGGRCR